MIHKHYFLVITAIFIVAAGNLFASNGTQIGTVGARATAMGSNSRGLADDWSAFHYNPAGLTQLQDKWTIGLSLGMIMPRGSYAPYAFPAAVPPFPGLSTDEATLVEQNFAVPSLAVFYKLSEKLTVGLGVAGPFGLGAKFDIIEIPTAYGNDTPLANTEETTSDHQVVNIQPTVALKLSNNISIGAGVGYIGLLKSPKLASTYMKLSQVAVPEYGDIIQEKSPNSYPGYLQLVGMLQLLGVYQPIHSRLILENNMDGKEGTAWNIDVGAHIKVSESLSFGVSGKYYTNLKLKGTMNRKVHFPGNTGIYSGAVAGYFHMVPGKQTVDSLTALGGIQALFPGVTTDTTYDAEAELPLPLTIGAGIAYKPIPKLTLTADISITRWSTWETIDINLTNQTTGEQESISMKENWKNTYEYGAGAEYCLLDQENMKLNLRGGFYMVDTPSPHSTISPTILDPKNRTVLTGGLGISLGKIQFSIAYERVMLGKATIPASEYEFDAESWGTNDNWAGVYELNANVITFETTIGL